MSSSRPKTPVPSAPPVGRGAPMNAASAGSTAGRKARARRSLEHSAHYAAAAGGRHSHRRRQPPRLQRRPGRVRIMIWALWFQWPPAPPRAITLRDPSPQRHPSLDRPPGGNGLYNKSNRGPILHRFKFNVGVTVNRTPPTPSPRHRPPCSGLDPTSVSVQIYVVGKRLANTPQ
jgi:hypothetical protein